MPTEPARPENSEAVVIVASEKLSEFIAILVANQFNEDVPLPIFGPSPQRDLVEKLLTNIWTDVYIDWEEYNLDPIVMCQFVKWLLTDNHMPGFNLADAYRITIPDLTGVMVFHFKDYQQKRLF